MFAKVTPWAIVRAHLATLHRYGSTDISAGDIALFYIVPGIVAAILIIAGVELGSTGIGILLSAFAIFAGLLLNLLVLIHTVVLRTSADQRRSERYLLLREVYANISYGVFISLLVVSILCFLPIVGRGIAVVSAVVYYIMGNFLLTLFMVLKRVHIMLEREFDAQ